MRRRLCRICSKKRGIRSCMQDIEQRRNDLLPGASKDAVKVAKVAESTGHKEAVPEERGQMSWRKWASQECSHVKMEDNGQTSRRNPWPKGSWIWKSKACEHEMKGEVAVHPIPTGADWTQLSCKIFSQEEQTLSDRSWCFSKWVWEDVWHGASAGESHSGARPGGRTRKCGGADEESGESRKWSACTKGAAVKGLQLVLFFDASVPPKERRWRQGRRVQLTSGRKRK